jgi:hypothetical protein
VVDQEMLNLSAMAFQAVILESQQPESRRFLGMKQVV